MSGNKTFLRSGVRSKHVDNLKSNPKTLTHFRQTEQDRRDSGLIRFQLELIRIVRVKFFPRINRKNLRVNLTDQLFGLMFGVLFNWRRKQMSNNQQSFDKARTAFFFQVGVDDFLWS